MALNPSFIFWCFRCHRPRWSSCAQLITSPRFVFYVKYVTASVAWGPSSSNPRARSRQLCAHTHTHTTEDEPSCGLPLEEHGGTAALFFHPTQVHWNVKKTVALVFTLRSIRFNSQIIARLTHTTVRTFNGNTHISLLDFSGFCESFLLFFTIKKHYNIPVHISHGVSSKHQWLRLVVVFHSLLWLYGYSRGYHKVGRVS